MIVKKFNCAECGASFNIYQLENKEESEKLNCQSLPQFMCTSCKYCDIIFNDATNIVVSKNF